MEHSNAILTFHRLLLVLAGTSACSRVGSDNLRLTDEGDFLSKKGLFLNLGAPSQCQGTVTAWHLHYGLSNCRIRPREGVLAVYRPINTGNQTMEYKIVPGSTKLVEVTCKDDGDDDTTKSADTRNLGETIIMLKTQEKFMIQSGDVIAICLPNRLQVLEEVASDHDTQRNDVYRYSGANINNCNLDRLQKIMPESRHLREKSNYRLHLYAEIAVHVGTSTDNSSSESLPLNDNQVSDSRAEYLVLVAAPTASVGGLLVLAAAVLLVTGIVVCWSRRYKQRKSTSSTTTNGTELRDTSTDQRSPSIQNRSRAHAPAKATVNVFDIKDNIAYQAYNFDEHVYAQPYAHQWRNEYCNDYEISSQYCNSDT